jgi:hypothetical protein
MSRKSCRRSRKVKGRSPGLAPLHEGWGGLALGLGRVPLRRVGRASVARAGVACP